MHAAASPSTCLADPNDEAISGNRLYGSGSGQSCSGLGVVLDTASSSRALEMRKPGSTRITIPPRFGHLTHHVVLLKECRGSKSSPKGRPRSKRFESTTLDAATCRHGWLNRTPRTIGYGSDARRGSLGLACNSGGGPRVPGEVDGQVAPGYPAGSITVHEPCLADRCPGWARYVINAARPGSPGGVLGSLSLPPSREKSGLPADRVAGSWQDRADLVLPGRCSGLAPGKSFGGGVKDACADRICKGGKYPGTCPCPAGGSTDIGLRQGRVQGRQLGTVREEMVHVHLEWCMEVPAQFLTVFVLGGGVSA